MVRILCQEDACMMRIRIYDDRAGLAADVTDCISEGNAEQTVSCARFDIYLAVKSHPPTFDALRYHTHRRLRLLQMLQHALVLCIFSGPLLSQGYTVSRQFSMFPFACHPHLCKQVTEYAHSGVTCSKPHERDLDKP